MVHILASIVLIVILSLAAVFLFRKLMPANNGSDPEVRVKKIGDDPQTVQAPPITQPEPLYYDEPQTERLRPRKGLSLMPLILLATIGCLVYTNQNLIAEKMPVVVTEFTMEKPKEAISVANVDGHAVVDGINWFRLVATSTSGVPFEGWVSEMAIQSEPPKENKMADEMMKKLGLPTQREKLEGARRLRGISESLNTSINELRNN